MLDFETISAYKTFKDKMDAAYAVFKNDPSVSNAATHGSAVQAFTNFCVNKMAELVNLPDTGVSNDVILENIEDYKTCKHCKAELLYATEEHKFIASSDFIAEFPGWCYPCLIEHCVNCDCSTCDIVPDPTKCSFLNVKELELKSEY